MIRFIIFLSCALILFSNFNALSNSRLHSDSIDVLHYDIHLNIVYISQKSITGFAELRINPKVNNMNKFCLDLLALHVDSVTIGNAMVSGYTYNDTLLTIPMQTPVNIGDTFTTRVYYHGQPVEDPSAWGGFYFSADSAYAYNLGVGFASNPHVFGRVWFPCLDDFVDRATYDTYIRVKTGNMAVCGGLLIGQQNNMDGTSTFHWNLSESIPTYLASVAVSNYVAVYGSYQGLQGTIPTYIYVNPLDTTSAKASFIHLNNALQIFENRFGPYLWSRAGFVAVPFNSGAMEHATNIAYPRYCIDGTLNYETLWAHELSHHWFGDLVTCSTALDMWLNEGWASYCEPVFIEGLYGKTQYDKYIKDNHKNVILNANIEDGSYYALYGVPHEYTYGTTVYKKGMDIIHTLRNYLGDSLFFSGMRAYLNQYKFNNASTTDLRNFLTNYTGINMNDFFETWIYTPGFPQFSIDSIVAVPNAIMEYDVSVYLRQKSRGASHISNSNKVEITFFDKFWNKHTALALFSGATAQVTLSSPFKPDFAIVDFYNKMSDAETDEALIIKTIGMKDFAGTYCQVDVKNISDSAYLRIEHNWVAPDGFKIQIPNLVVSKSRYWKIDGILPHSVYAKPRFYFHKGLLNLDQTWITNTVDSLVLLYRENTGKDWRKIPFTKIGNSTLGYLIADSLWLGEYTLGLYDYNWPVDRGEVVPKKSDKLNIRPNPSNGSFEINFNLTNDGKVNIINTSGKLMNQYAVSKNQKNIFWNPKKYPVGTYIVSLEENGKMVASSKIVYAE